MVRRHAMVARALPPSTPIHDVFSIAARAGFAGVEIRPAPDSAASAAVLDAMASTGIAVSSVEVAGPRWGAGLLAEGDRLEANVVLALAALRNAADWGARTVLVVPGRVAGDVSTEDAWGRSADVMGGRLVPVAEELGVRIGVENVWGGFVTSAADLARFVDEQGSVAVGAYFDVGNVVFGHPHHWIPVLGDRLVGVHYKDVRMRPARRGRLLGFAMPGSGDVDWGRVDLALADVGYDGWLAYPPPPPPRALRLVERIDRALPERSGLVGAARARLDRLRVGLRARQMEELVRGVRERDAELESVRS